MECNNLKKLLENLFSENNEYIILKKDDALRLKEAVEKLMDTYNHPRIRNPPNMIDEEIKSVLRK